MPLRYVKVATLDQVSPGSTKGVKPAPGYNVALCNADGTVYAIEDSCTHAGGIMHFGDLVGDEIQCPVHLGTFDIKTGEATGGPASEPLRTFPTRISGGNIEVGIEE